LLAQVGDQGIIIGLGLNVEMNIEELPVETATSLAISGSKELNRNLILSKFLNVFEDNFANWEKGANFLDRYSQVCATLGRQVQIEVTGRTNRTGIAQSVNEFGALLLDDGFEVNVGDVVHLR